MSLPAGIMGVLELTLLWECWNWLYHGSSGTDFIMRVLELIYSQFQHSHDTMIPLCTTDRSVSETSICQHATFTHRQRAMPPSVFEFAFTSIFRVWNLSVVNETLELKRNLRQRSNAVHSKTHKKLLELTFIQFQHSHDTSRQRHTCVIPETVIQFRCSWWWAKISLETYRAAKE